MQTEEELKHSLEDKSTLGKKRSNYAQKKEIASKDHFLSMKHNLEEDKLRMEQLDEEELQ